MSDGIQKLQSTIFEIETLKKDVWAAHRKIASFERDLREIHQRYLKLQALADAVRAISDEIQEPELQAGSTSSEQGWIGGRYIVVVGGNEISKLRYALKELNVFEEQLTPEYWERKREIAQQIANTFGGTYTVEMPERPVKDEDRYGPRCKWDASDGEQVD